MDRSNDVTQTNGTSHCLVYQFPLPLMSLNEWIERRCYHDDVLCVYRDEKYGVLMLTNTRSSELFILRDGADAISD